MPTTRSALRRTGLALAAVAALAAPLASCAKDKDTADRPTTTTAKERAASSTGAPSLKGAQSVADVDEAFTSYEGPYKAVTTSSDVGSTVVDSRLTVVHDDEGRSYVTSDSGGLDGPDTYSYAEVYDGDSCWGTSPASAPLDAPGVWERHTLDKGMQWASDLLVAPTGVDGDGTGEKSFTNDGDKVVFVQDDSGDTLTTTISLGDDGVPTRAISERAGMWAVTTTYDWGTQKVALPSGEPAGTQEASDHCQQTSVEGSTDGAGDTGMEMPDGGGYTIAAASAASLARSANAMAALDASEVTTAVLADAVAEMSSVSPSVQDPTVNAAADHVELTGSDGSAACVRIEAGKAVVAKGSC